MAKTPRQALEETLKKVDKGIAELVLEVQSEVAFGAPVKTGRLSSSWFIGKNKPDRTVKPEGEYPTPDLNEFDGDITINADWYISSNLPYSAIAALDPGYVGQIGGKGDWYTRVVNSLPARVNKVMEKNLR